MGRAEASMNTWRKHPSVTTGGKPYFYRLFDQAGDWQASVIWNRSVRAYAVEVVTLLVNRVRTGKLLTYAGTVQAGKRQAEQYLRQVQS